jgi:hypothetical protein
MTKILHVYGEDYAALSFDNLVEKGEATAKELWAEANSAGRFLTHEDDEAYFEYKALTFGEVDPKFIDWVQSEQDYDDSKHARFYVIGD